MAKSKILYTETQHHTQWWLWVLLIVLSVLLLYEFIKEIITQQDSNIILSNIIGMIIGLLVLVLVGVLLWVCKLNTVIATDGVYVRYFPFHRRYKYFAWDDIQEAYIRKYKPVKEYGGWGLRRYKSFEVKFKSGKNIAYNVSGNMGLQLVLKNGKKILIGTRKPELVQEALEKVKNYQQIGKSI